MIIIQETLLWFTLDKYLGIFLSLAAVFICFYKLFYHRFFQYFNCFRFEEFRSVLWSIDYLIDNKQINFKCFFGILPTKSRMSLKSVTNKLNINCFCLNPSDKITNINGIALRRKFDIILIRYTLPYSHSWQFLWYWELASLSTSAPGMFGFFLSSKNFLVINCPFKLYHT